jgi:hypothetical protein
MSVRRLRARVARLEHLSRKAHGPDRARGRRKSADRRFRATMGKLNSEIRAPAYWRLVLHFWQYDQDCARLAELSRKEPGTLTE